MISEKLVETQTKVYATSFAANAYLRAGKLLVFRSSLHPKQNRIDAGLVPRECYRYAERAVATRVVIAVTAVHVTGSEWSLRSERLKIHRE